MRILLVTSEYEGLVKVGGLSDFARAMANELAAQGHDIRILLPAYRAMEEHTENPLFSPVNIRTSLWENWPASFVSIQNSGPKIYAVKQDYLFDRPGIYDEPGINYDDNAMRFGFLSQAAFHLCKALNWQPDIMLCNDWPSAMAPFYLRAHYWDDAFFHSTKSIMIIHNGAHQGEFDYGWHERLGIHPKYMVSNLFGDTHINMLRAALRLSDKIVTVSPNYRDELLRKHSDHGLRHLLRPREKDFVGIVNGVDYEQWNPEKDPHIKHRYSADNLQGKAMQKREALADRGWLIDEGKPLIAYIGRIAGQKGLDELYEIYGHRHELPFKLALAGTGEKQICDQLYEWMQRCPDIHYLQSFTPAATRGLLAGADYLIMPSHFEPCGLTQLYALRYGTIPIVRDVGGLANTVWPIDSHKTNVKEATGYRFGDNLADVSLEEILVQVVTDYRDDAMTTRHLRINGMKSVFSWKVAADRYLALMNELTCLGHEDQIRRTANF